MGGLSMSSSASFTIDLLATGLGGRLAVTRLRREDLLGVLRHIILCLMLAISSPRMLSLLQQ